VPPALTSILGNAQRLDGGAMFGNVPRALWATWIAPDDRHRIPLACRCLLVEDGGRRILFETGIGAAFSPKLRERFGVVEDRHVLLEGLAAVGVAPEDVDVVVLSHLHFDHAGGLLTPWAEGRAPALAFPRATVVVGAEAWARARAPHARDRASFLPELAPLLEARGRLEVVAPDDARAAALGDLVRFHVSHGHTPGLLLAELATAGGPVVFAADLIPGRAWVHLPVTMGYDRYPELLIDEKAALLGDLVARGGRLFFTHDPEIAMSSVVRQGERFVAVDDHPTLARWTGAPG
jgi:glyoxylase-like metal-dependent hydrolase (beta-lactamase superfamily II)